METEAAFLEASEVARRAGVSPDTVRRDAKLGALQVAGRTSAGKRLFTPAAVDAYVATRRARGREAAHVVEPVES